MQKKVSDTLAQRKKAQESFLELKKAEQNAAASGGQTPPPPEKKPMTRKEKLANFWFYHKWALIAGVAFALVLAVTVRQCATRPKADLTVVLYSNEIVADQNADLLQEYFETLCPDFNGDGQVRVTIINCTYETGVSTGEYQLAKMQKLQSEIGFDSEAMLYLTNQEGYDYVDSISDADVLGDPRPFPTQITQEYVLKTAVPCPDLWVSVRNLAGTKWESDAAALEAQSRAQQVFAQF